MPVSKVKGRESFLNNFSGLTLQPWEPSEEGSKENLTKARNKMVIGPRTESTACAGAADHRGKFRRARSKGCINFWFLQEGSMSSQYPGFELLSSSTVREWCLMCLMVSCGILVFTAANGNSSSDYVGTTPDSFPQYGSFPQSL